MDLSNLHPPVGSRKKRKRVGRGESSGLGKTSGKGHKGQNARSGTGGKVGFEGGQMPLMRRLPKYGFTNINRQPVHVVSLDHLNAFNDGDTVSEATLKEQKLVPNKFSGRIKVLANGKLEKKLTIELDRVSAGAKAAIEKAGGSVVTTKKQD
jgi:large subunit ribosomal protein L15